jgi:hypothetical protein
MNRLFKELMIITLLIILVTGCSSSTPVIDGGGSTTVRSQKPASATATPVGSEVGFELSALLSEGEGEIQGKQPYQDEFSYVETGYVLQSMGQLSTGKDARAKLDISDGSIVRLGANSSFTLVRAEQQDGSWLTKVQLHLGQIWVILQGGSLEVDTISGTASVRGSYLSVSVDGNGELYITCLEGACALFNAGGRCDLYAGQTAIVPHVTALPVMGAMLQEDMHTWMDNIPEAAGMMDAMKATAQAYGDLTTGDPDDDGYQGFDDMCPLRGNFGYGVDQYGCPHLPPDQDADHDGVMNEFDLCPNLGDLGYGVDDRGCPLPFPDADNDGYPDVRDLCPNQGDLGYGLNSMGCPIPEPGFDIDGDGILNEDDACPMIGDQGNGVHPNGCPIITDLFDRDGDGVLDVNDACPDQPGPSESDGCPDDEPAASDRDGDGIIDEVDQCPDEAGLEINGGCPVDSDNDGILDRNDGCPEQPGPRTNDGCPEPTEPVQTDSDGDGVPDETDQCPNQSGLAVNNGCPLDSDGDGVPDGQDNCPNQAGPILNGGCPEPPPAQDSDGDGVPDDEDDCPNEAGFAVNNGCPLLNP